MAYTNLANKVLLGFALDSPDRSKQESFLAKLIPKMEGTMPEFHLPYQGWILKYHLFDLDPFEYYKAPHQLLVASYPLKDK